MDSSKIRAALRATRRTAFRFRYLFAASLVIGTASFAQPVTAPEGGTAMLWAHPAVPSDLSVMTYNVKGLPWPFAWKRPEAMQRIGARLLHQRAYGLQPHVVVLQEAFTDEARAIGRAAGYAYQVQGPYLRSVPGVREERGGRWYRGETQPSALDSGLIVLSDFPVVNVRRAPFPTDACAGYDCIAAKGILLVTVDVPGHGAVDIATTHLNSRAAAGVDFERTHEAYRRQTAFVAAFLARRDAAGRPLVLAGDFNRGERPARLRAFAAAFEEARNGLEIVRKAAPDGVAHGRDASWITERGRDMQLIYDGADIGIKPVSVEVPFGTETDGTTISDHMGFTIRYRLVARAKAA